MRCGPVAQWQSFDSAFCGRWFDPQKRKPRYTLLMKLNKVEILVQWFRISLAMFVEFYGHGNLIYNILPLLKKENIHKDTSFNNDGDSSKNFRKKNIVNMIGVCLCRETINNYLLKRVGAS